MAETQVFEGTSKEVAEKLRSSTLAGRFRVTIVPEETNTDTGLASAQNGVLVTPLPNAKGLAVLREIAERHKRRAFTSAEGTDRMLREARAGAMYGYDPCDE